MVQIFAEVAGEIPQEGSGASTQWPEQYVKAQRSLTCYSCRVSLNDNADRRLGCFSSRCRHGNSPATSFLMSPYLPTHYRTYTCLNLHVCSGSCSDWAASKSTGRLMHIKAQRSLTYSSAHEYLALHKVGRAHATDLHVWNNVLQWQLKQLGCQQLHRQAQTHQRTAQPHVLIKTLISPNDVLHEAFGRLSSRSCHRVEDSLERAASLSGWPARFLQILCRRLQVPFVQGQQACDCHISMALTTCKHPLRSRQSTLPRKSGRID